MTLQFSHKYDDQHALAYHRKHRENWRRRLNNWREQQLARRLLTLAGNPRSILDLPCGTGRFWPLLAADPGRRLLAADFSAGMLLAARRLQPPAVAERFFCFQTDARTIALPAGSVECLFSMRLMHHLAAAADRLAILDEFHRVSRRTVCLSLWVTGNLQACRRKRLERRRPPRPYVNRIALPAATVEAEYRQAGFNVRNHLDLLPGISSWRFYLLEKS